jgi:hypothetical protein
MELLNFQVEIPNLKGSNSTIKVGFSSPFLYKPSESTLIQTASILGWTMYEIDSYHKAPKTVEILRSAQAQNFDKTL